MPPSQLNDDIVRIAREMGALAELCHFVEYDPKIGRVPGHFEPRWEVAEIVRRLLAERAAGCPSAGPGTPG